MHINDAPGSILEEPPEEEELYIDANEKQGFITPWSKRSRSTELKGETFCLSA